MPSKCVFEFYRPNLVYYSGETITGHIQLTTTKPKNLKKAFILFHGYAKVRWEEGTAKTSYDNRNFRGNESYVKMETQVCPEGVLAPGSYTYPFCLPLPEECPTSCVGKYGRIHYEVSLVINRPYRFDNVFKRPLTVIKQLNLNSYPDMLLSLTQEEIKYFCCWPCKSGPIISTLNIPFGGYVPGQKIKYSVEINNQSPKYDLNRIKVKLIMAIKFTAQLPRFKTCHHNVILKTVEQREQCLRLTKRILEGELLIPPTPPSSKNVNSIIEISYYIKMSLKTGDCHTDSSIKLPITIGTIPLLQTFGVTDNDQTIEVSTESKFPEPTNIADAPPAYDICVPPSFEEATKTDDNFVDPDADGHHSNEDFVPKYPVYSNLDELNKTSA